MQDINPIKKTLDVKESVTPDSIDLRTSIGVSDINNLPYSGNQNNPQTIQAASTPKETTPLKRREEIAFSSLYTPESRRNVVKKPLPQNSAPIRPLPVKNKKSSGIYTFLGLSIAVLAFVLYTFVFNSARVVLTPVRTTIDINKVITIPVVDIELGSDVLTVVATSSDSKSIPRRGATKVETKASGTITVFNNFDTNPQRLITNTRFESKTGKTYRIAESVIVPGMKGTTPGSIDVVVYADSIGSDYNAESAEFTIPGFKGTPRFAKFTAKTKTKLDGGASGTQDAIADEDINIAHTELTNSLKSTIEQKIKAQDPGEEYVRLVDNTVYSETDNRNELITDPKAKYTQELTAKAFFIKKDYLSKKLIEGTNHTEQENLLLESTDQIVFGGIQKDSNISAGDISFTVTGNPSFISKVDQDSIKTALVNKNKSQFETIMSSFRGVEKAEPHFNPFWLRSFPSSPDKIKIELSK